MLSKIQIREEAKAFRHGLSREQCLERSELLRSHIAQWWIKHSPPTSEPISRLFLFAALKGEPDLLPLAGILSARDFALPRILNKTIMEFRRYRERDEFVKGPLGIREPSPAAPVILPSPGDVIIVPALALSTSGQRIGQGAGYYDRYLAGIQSGVILMGVCFSEGLFAAETWQDDPYDLGVHWVATEKGIKRVV